MASEEFEVYDYLKALRYPDGINKYLYDWLIYINEHGGGGGGATSYEALPDKPTFNGKFLKSSKGGVDNNPDELGLQHLLIGAVGHDKQDLVGINNNSLLVKENFGITNLELAEKEHQHSINDLTDLGTVLNTKEDIVNKVETVPYNTSSIDDKKAYLSVNAYKKDLPKQLKDLVGDMLNIFILNKDLPFPNFFVSVNGDDENAGNNPIAPAKTLDKIMSIIEPNKVIHVRYPANKEYLISDVININKNVTLLCSTDDNSVFEAINNSNFFSVASGVTLVLHNFSYLYNGEKSFISKLEIINAGTEPLIIDYDYIKEHKLNTVSLRANLDDTSNKFNEYLYIDGKYELLGVDDYNDLENRIKLDGQLLSSESTFDGLGIQRKLVGDGSSPDQNVKTINGENVLGTGNIEISGGGEASTYASLPDKPELDGHVLGSGNNSLSDLGIASVTVTNVLEDEVNTAKEDILNVKNKVATAFDKTSTTTSPSCKAISDYLQAVLDSLDVSEVEL